MDKTGHKTSIFFFNVDHFFFKSLLNYGICYNILGIFGPKAPD